MKHKLHILMQQYLLTEWKQNQYITYYSFTISPHKRLLSKALIESSVDDLMTVCKNVVSCRYVYETSELNKIHIHGILASKSKSKFMKLRKHPLVKYELNEYYNSNDAWIHYMAKESPHYCYTHHYDHETGKIQKPKLNLTWYAFVEDSSDEE